MKQPTTKDKSTTNPLEEQLPADSSATAEADQTQAATPPASHDEATTAQADPLAQANAQITELTNDLQRTRADFENYRKQMDLQKNQAVMIAKFSVVDQFLPLIDNFERAMQTYPEQLAPLEKSFEKTLREAGLARIDSSAGTEFSPDLHDAVMIEEGDGDTEVITETLRPGYTYNGSVVRTAMVKVKHQ